MSMSSGMLIFLKPFVMKHHYLSMLFLESKVIDLVLGVQLEYDFNALGVTTKSGFPSSLSLAQCFTFV